MYLSLLTIDIRDNSPARSWIQNRYRVHQRLCMAFPSSQRKQQDPFFLTPYDPNQPDNHQVHVKRNAAGGFLYRIDPIPAKKAHIIVQSALQPDWNYAFQNIPYYLGAPTQIREIQISSQHGAHYQFRLEVNPTKKIETKTGADGKKRNGRRIPVPSDEIPLWLTTRCAKLGFSVDAPQIHVEQGYANMKKNASDTGRKLKTARFEGTLTVTNPSLFSDCRMNGIGPAKAFGFGLLSVAPL